jgi:hypothetical protein
VPGFPCARRARIHVPPGGSGCCSRSTLSRLTRILRVHASALLSFQEAHSSGPTSAPLSPRRRTAVPVLSTVRVRSIGFLVLSMCCGVHKRHSPSRAHICGGGESGLDPRGVQPPHVALTPSRAPGPQDLPFRCRSSPGFKKNADPPIYSPPRAGRARPQSGAQPPSFSSRSAALATGNIPPLSPTVMRRNIVDRA